MKTGSPVIEVSALRVEREAVILESIDGRVQRGEHGRSGANGSGKTSLLRALTGYLPPTAARSRARPNLWTLRLARASDPHRPGQFERASDTEDTETALKAIVSGRYAQMATGARCAGGPSRRRRYPPPYRGLRSTRSSVAVSSQGERQRVLIGRALTASPRPTISTSRAPASTRSRANTSCSSFSASPASAARPRWSLSLIMSRRSPRFSRTCSCSSRDACSTPDLAREYLLPRPCPAPSPLRCVSLARAADTHSRFAPIAEQ